MRACVRGRGGGGQKIVVGMFKVTKLNQIIMVIALKFAFQN